MRTGNGSLNTIVTSIVRLTSIFLLLVLGLFPENAFAINCRVTLFAIDFGIYMPLHTAHLEITGQVDVRCQAQPGSFSVTIGPGASGNQLARILTSGGPDILNYNLYRDAARTQIWGDGSPPTFVVSGVRPSRGRPSIFNYPVYGRVFANQAPNPGIYNDNLLVTVLF